MKQEPFKRRLYRVVANQIDIVGSKEDKFKKVVIVATCHVEAARIVNRHGYIISGCRSRLIANACKEVERKDMQWYGDPWWGEIKGMLINIRPILDDKKEIPKINWWGKLKRWYNKIRWDK